MSADAFVDSNVWLYALVLNPGEADKHRRAQALLDASSGYVLSTQVVAEVSVNLLKKAGFAETELQETVTDFYLSHRVVETGLQCHRRASLLRTVYRLSYWDSLVVAAAYESGCTVCYSEDMQHGLLIDHRLRILNPLIDRDREH